jgi:RNA polymerase sigma-70 factor (ECF subfamily)
MSDPDSTRHSLLARIRDLKDADAWSEFVEVYTPFVYGFVQRRGLQSADASDVTQDVMRTVFLAVNGFEHEQRKGSFRSWLITIARRRLSDFLSRQNRQIAGSGDTGMIGQPWRTCPGSRDGR